jgi:hypothetical protein
MAYVDAELREELLKLQNGNAFALFRTLKPPFSASTFNRGISGYKVGDEVVSWFRSQHALHTMRIISDDHLYVGLKTAHMRVMDLRGRKVSYEDFEREVRLYLQNKTLLDDAEAP